MTSVKLQVMRTLDNPTFLNEKARVLTCTHDTE